MEKKINDEGRSIGNDIPIPKKPTEYDENDPFYGTVRVKKNSFVGHVISAKAHKTATILVDRQIYVKKYGRYLKRSTKINVHNPASIDAKEGDVVKIYETRPLSKTKHHVIVQVLGQHVDIKGQDLAKEAKDKETSTKVETKDE